MSRYLNQRKLHVAELTERVAASEDNPQVHYVAKVQLAQAQKVLDRALSRVKPAKSEPAPPPVAPAVATQPPPAPVSGVVEREDPIAERPVPEEVKEPASIER